MAHMLLRALYHLQQTSPMDVFSSELGPSLSIYNTALRVGMTNQWDSGNELKLICQLLYNFKKRKKNIYIYLVFVPHS